VNTFSILMIALIVLGLNLGFIALAVKLGTHKLQSLLEQLVALEMGAQQRAVQQQVHDSVNAPRVHQWTPPTPQH